MSDKKSQFETKDNEQYIHPYEREVFGGRILEAVMNFLGSITLLITIIAAIIFFIKFKWLIGFSTLFLGIVLTFILFAISKIIQLGTNNTIRMAMVEAQLNELVEDGVVSLVIDPDIKMPGRETRRNKNKLFKEKRNNNDV